MNRRFLLVLSWTSNSRRGIKNLSLPTTRKQKKSCEPGPENGKPKFNQTKRRSDNGGSARVDSLTQSQFIHFEMAFWSARSGWKQTITLLFSFFFFWFLFSYAIQGKSITWRGNSTLICSRKPISHESRSDECDMGFQVQFNVEFTSQVMDFPWIA